MGDSLKSALEESLAHAVLTIEMVAGGILGLIFILLYLQRTWWETRQGRLTMFNMLVLTLVCLGGFSYRLGYQPGALSILVPTAAACIVNQGWWLRQLIGSSGEARRAAQRT